MFGQSLKFNVKNSEMETYNIIYFYSKIYFFFKDKEKNYFSSTSIKYSLKKLIRFMNITACQNL